MGNSEVLEGRLEIIRGRRVAVRAQQPKTPRRTARIKFLKRIAR